MQAQENEVRATVEKMFTAMRTSDTALLKTVFSDDAIMQTTLASANGSASIRNVSVRAFLESVAKNLPGDADEQIRFDAVHIDGAIASVWTSYRFYYKGNFSHCGVNSFQLVRQTEGWKIQYIIDTRRKEGCNW
ncbi:MAG: nuclear transport factor 2 family protein [Chitinophagaceae bacterium]